jgi:F-type H+-transporting ATPase subunit c
VRSLILAAMAVLASERGAGGGCAGGGRQHDRSLSVLVAGFAMAFAAGLCALGQGKAIASAVDAMARQPGAAARIQTAMIIGLALIESLAIYVLVVAMILLFVQPIK